MRLYIDRDNVESFVQSYDSNTDLYDRCNTMLKRHFDIHVNCTDEELVSSEECMSWINSLLDGRETSHKFSNGLKSDMPICRPIVSSTFPDNTEREFHSSVYLLNEDVDLLIEKGNYLVGGVGDELKTLSSLLIGDEDDQYSLSLEPIKKFFYGGWSVLNKSTLPSSDIIISDAFILSNKSLYEKNLYAFIETISTNICASSLNIVIFCLKETEYDKKTISPDWQVIRQEIKNKLSKNAIDTSVTFVAPENSKEFEEHDRTVFTNYIYYAPGACLNFYSSAGDFSSRGRHFEIKSLSKTSNMEAACVYLDDMQNLVDAISDGTKAGYIDKDKCSRLSNYIKFPE